MLARVPAVCAGLLLIAGAVQAQSSTARDGWLMQNYRFAGPPAAGATPVTDPVVAQLQEIQNTTLAILRKANFAGDYEAALAAASQAVANAQLIGAILERQRPPGKTTSAEPPSQPALYLIALRNRSVQAARAYWTDGRMLHCMTVDGAHEQIRLDLVDLERTRELNRRPDPKERSY